MDVAEFFRARRFDVNTHLGLGDIRLTPHYQQCIEAEIARLTAELASAQASEKATARVLEAFCTQRDKARAELAEAKERERVLREAVEKAPHQIMCAIHKHERTSVTLPDGSTIAGFETRHMGLPCDCWKRAALGEP